MAGGMKDPSFEFQVSSFKFERREVAAALAMAVNLKPETRNPKPAARDSRVVAAAVSLATMLLGAWPLSSGAQTMIDPTRPPPSVLPAAPGGEEQAGEPLLQSVMISRTERSAIIGGERVKLGGKYRDAQVVSITETEVVLRSAHGNETLRLYPGIEMKPVKPVTSAAPKAARKPAIKPTTTRGKQQ